MPLTRKLRRAGGSVAVTIPSDFAKAMDFHEGDRVEIEPLDPQRLALRKSREQDAADES
jgi:antitoxin component of MazEF toxin-antitoxin module